MSELTAPTSGSPLSPALRGRLDAHRNELRRLHDALAQRPHPEERAILAGALLGASGYLIRRSRALTAEGRGDLVTVDAALKSLAREDIAAWLARASTAGLRQALQRAADAAFEVALSDDDEREGHKEAALEGLAERETLAATLTALRRWEEQNSPLEDRSARRRDALEAEAKNADDALRKAAFALTPLNPERRAERDLLDGAHQHEAWWYALQADNDEAVALMTGSPTHTSFLHDQPQVSQAIQLAQSPPRRHLSEEELWAYDLGAMNKDQRSWVSRHAASCPDCKRALRALSEGEDAINEALGAAPLRSQPAAIEPDQEVAFEHQHFRALVFRSAKKIRLVIEEKTPGSLRAVSPSLKPRRLRGGFEVQLRPAARTEPATSRLTVTLAAGDDVGFDVALRLPQARCAGDLTPAHSLPGGEGAGARPANGSLALWRTRPSRACQPRLPGQMCEQSPNSGRAGVLRAPLLLV